jgi:GNAT superfamily N-acetyltransferase
MSGAAFHIARARHHDLAEAAALYHRVATATLHWMPPNSFTPEVFLEQARYETIWLAWMNGWIVGLAALYEPDSFLHSLYVDAGRQGQGIGLALLNTVSSAARGPLSLKVEEQNLRARRFYAREGFRELESGMTDGSRWILLSR